MKIIKSKAKFGHITAAQKFQNIAVGLTTNFFSIKKAPIFKNLTKYFSNTRNLDKYLNKINHKFNIKIKKKEFIKNPTVANILQLIKKTAIERNKTKENTITIKLAPPKKYYVLSHAQKRMFILNKLEPNSTSYNSKRVFEITDLNIRTFKKALQILVDRHEPLRTNFVERASKPVQIIKKRIKVNLRIINIGQSCVSTTERFGRGKKCDDYKKEKELEIIKKETKIFFRLDSDPLCRFVLIKLDKKKYTFIMVIHHIITDRRSMAVLIHDLIRIYGVLLKKNKPKFPELLIQYKDYAEWEQSRENVGRLKKQEQYWLKQLSSFRQGHGKRIGRLPILNLPVDKLRPPFQSDNGGVSSITINKATTRELKRLCDKTNTTLFTLLLTVFYVFLFRVTGQKELIIGTPGTNRNCRELEDMIGLLFNSLVLCCDLSGDPGFPELLKQIKKTVIEAVENNEYSFDHLIEKLNPRRDMSRSPIFNVMFQVDNKPTKRLFNKVELDLKPKSIIRDTAKFDIRMRATETATGVIYFSCEYNTDLFFNSTIAEFLKIINNLIQQILKNPNKKLSDLEIIDTEAKRKLLYEFNNTKSRYPKNKTIHELIEKQAKKTPDNIALQYKNKFLTYQKLNEKANRLAGCFKSLGLKRGDVVAIIIDPAPKLACYQLAAHKAGGCCLLIEPGQLRKRVEYILKDSGAKILLSSNKEKKYRSFKGIVVNIKKALKENEKSRSLIKNINKSTDSAYLIYTSGSTGKPRGVILTHRGIINHAYTKIKIAGIVPEDTVAQNLSVSFVAFIWQFVATLIVGAKIELYPRDIAIEPIKLFRYMREKKVTVLEIVPSLLNSYLSITDNQKDFLKNAYLRYLMLTGEKLPPDLVNKYYKKYKIPLINAYGQAECSDDTLHYLIPRKINYTHIFAGTPSINTQCYILDQNQNLLPPNIPGELYISGDGLTRGYLNNPKRTGQFFLPHPFIKDKKIYRTGDGAKMRSDGNIEILNRLDQQIKIRGIRIEPNEIEARIRKIDNIKDAVVVKYNEALAAYYTFNRYSPVGQGGGTKDKRLIKIEVIKADLKTNLPSYMIPTYFICLKEMPLNSSGKIDWNRLPEPDEKSLLKQKYEKPVAEVEKNLAKIWQKVLGVKKISRYDNFFDLGGHSLKAISLLSRINKKFKIDLPLKNIFINQIFFELARSINKQEKTMLIEIKPAPKNKYYPLSHAQERMFILYKLKPASPHYNMHYIRELSGQLNVSVLKRSLKKLIDRHEPLRTTFQEINFSKASNGGQPAQVMHSRVKNNLEIIDLSIQRSGKNIKNKIKIIKKLINTPLKLEIESAARFALVKIKKDRYIFIFVIHHIISDGQTLNILSRELTEIYNALLNNKKLNLPKLFIQYKDYAVWERSKENKKRLKKQEKYWLKKYVDKIPILNLPVDKPRPRIQAYRGSVNRVIIDSKTAGKLKQLCHQRDISLFNLLFAVFNVFIYRLTGQGDIVVGIPVSERNYTEIENTVGFFINTLAVRSKLFGNKPFDELLNNINGDLLDDYSNKEYYFERLVKKLNPERDMSRSPLFDIFFQMGTGEYDDWKNKFDKINKSKYVPIETRVAQFDLKVFATDLGNRMSIVFNYNTDLFNRDTIIEWLKYFKIIIGDIAHEPRINISELKMLGEEEKRKLLYKFNNTGTEYSKIKTIHQIFEKQAEKTPNNIAIKFKNKELTYKELNEKANQLARYLKKECKIKPGNVAAIMLDRSLEMIISLLAVLKTGGAYLPIDPEFPAKKIKYMLDNSSVKIVIVNKIKLRNRGAEYDTEYQLLDIDSLDLYKDYSVTNLNIRVKANGLAYIIYTSGSTGSPKGVMVEHRAAVNFIVGIYKDIKFNGKDKILFSTTLSFDISFLETVLPLTSGMSIVIAGEEEKKDPRLLGKLIINNDINIIQMTPFAARMMVGDKIGRQSLKNLKKILIGGDMLADDLLAKVQKITNAKIYNMYGPVETTIWSAYKDISKDSKASISTPLANTKLYILDKDRCLLPPGIPGELYISGDGLARGYLNDPQKTKEVFLPHPFLKGERIYKTGDKAKMRPDGKIEILGRIDQQIKIRGFRIEPGEIEANILKIGNIKDCVVVKYGETLAGYYSTKNKRPINIEKIKTSLKTILSDYMIPAYYVYLKEMPLTPSGKVDRKNLPDPKEKYLQKVKYTEPWTNTEKKLVKIWQNVLSVKKISIYDDFFDLGGHSLKAIGLLMDINKEFKINLPLKEIFLNPAIHELVSAINKLIKKPKAKDLLIPALKPRPHYPLTNFQNVIWMAVLSSRYGSLSAPIALELHGRVNAGILQKTLQKIIDRHEGLRTNFLDKNKEIIQIIAKNRKIKIKLIDITKKKDQHNIIKKLARQTIDKAFNLNDDLLIRALLIRVTGNRHILILAIHSIIFDNASYEILREELMLLYNYFINNTNYPLKDLPIKYSDYILWENAKDLKKQEDYWLNRFSDKYPVVKLPIDKIKEPRQIINKNNIEALAINGKIVKKINELCRNYKITHFMFFMAVLKVFLHKITGQDDLMIGSVVSKRENKQTEGVFGPLISTLAFRSRVNARESFANYLVQIKKITTEALDNKDVPLSSIIEKIGRPVRSGTPLANVFFRVHHSESGGNEKLLKADNNFTIKNYNLEHDDISHELELFVIIAENSIIIKMIYNSCLFRKKTIQGLIKKYYKILTELAVNPQKKISSIN